MPGEKAKKVERDAVGNSLQQRPCGRVGVVAKAGMENEVGKNQLLRPRQKSDCCETQIRENQQCKDLELPDKSFLREHHARQMKQRERHNKLRRNEAPCLIVKWLSGNTRYGENGKCNHRQRGSLYPAKALAQAYRLTHHGKHQQSERQPVD